METPTAEELNIIAEIFAFPLSGKIYLSPADRKKAIELDPEDLEEKWLARVRLQGISRFPYDRYRRLIGWVFQGEEEYLSFYARAADQLLLWECDHLKLRLEPFGTSFYEFLKTEEDGSLFWVFLSQKLNPDFLCALKLHKEGIYKEGFNPWEFDFDPISSSSLRQLLTEKGLMECHLHSGSAWRPGLIWPVFLINLTNPDFVRDIVFRAFQKKDFSFLQLLPYFRIACSLRMLFIILLFCKNLSVTLGEAARLFGRILQELEGLKCLEDKLEKKLTGKDKKRKAAVIAFLERWALITRALLRGLGEMEGAGRALVSLYHGPLTSLSEKLLERSLLTAHEPYLLLQITKKIDTAYGKEREEFLWLFLTYLRLKNLFHRYFIHQYQMAGLDLFREIFERAKWIKKLRDLFQSPRHPKLFLHHLSPRRELKGVEIRTSPEPSDILNLVELSEALECEGLKAGVVVHEVKREALFSRDGLEAAWGKLHDSLGILKIFVNFLRFRGRIRYLLGFDVAGSEQAVPNWFYAPIFYVLRYLWAKKFKVFRGFTFHAGEDYAHPIQGLRKIWEVIALLPWRDGDRIGHGLALGDDVESWVRENRVVLEPLAEIFDDLIWEWGIYNFFAPEGYRERWRTILEREIGRISEALFRPISTFFNNYENFFNNYENRFYSWWDLYLIRFDPWIIVRLFPGFYNFYGIKGQAQRYLYKKELYEQNPPVEELKYFLNRLFAQYREQQTKTYPCREDYVQRYKVLQKFVLEEVARRRVALEACPLSNLEIRLFRALRRHPLLNLPEPFDQTIAVLVCSDNLFTFNTTLRQEIQLFFTGIKNPAEALEILRRRVDDSHQKSFLT